MDVTLLVRDPMVALAILVPFMLTALGRWGVPLAAERAAPWVDLAPWYPFMATFLVLLTPMMFGWVAGFLLLEERDDHVLEAVAVTPGGLPGFLAWRMVLPVLFSFVASLVVVPLSGLATFSAAALVPAAALAAVEAPIMTAWLAAFANDKVQGLALAKMANMALLAPIALVVVPAPWHALAGISPPYWVARALLAGSTADVVISVVAGVIVHAAALAWLLRRLSRRLG